MFSDLKCFAFDGVKLPCKKSFFLANFALLAGFFGICATICLCLPYAEFLIKKLSLHIQLQNTLHQHHRASPMEEAIIPETKQVIKFWSLQTKTNRN